MCKRTSIRNLQIILALDSLSLGLLYQSIGQHILKLGGSHAAEGLLAVGLLIGELLSREITKRIALLYGKKNGLLLILYISLLIHLLTIMTKSVQFLILVRILFSAVNQTKRICYDLLLENENNLNARDRLNANYTILVGCGYILGPIFSGHLLEKGFYYVAILASFLIMVNIALLMYVDSKNKNCPCAKKSMSGTFKEAIMKRLEELNECQLKTHWDILLVKYLFSCSVLIFSTKFRQLLLSNYDIDSPVILGYTEAYMISLVFVSMCYIPETPDALQLYPLMFVSEMLFFFVTVFSILACYAPSYRTFMVLLMPLAFLRTTIVTMWKDLFWERQNESLERLSKLAGIVAGFTVPMLFGIVYNQINHNAVIIFTCIPLMLCFIIIRRYSKYWQHQNQLDSDETCCNSSDEGQ